MSGERQREQWNEGAGKVGGRGQKVGCCIKTQDKAILSDDAVQVGHGAGAEVDLS